MKVLNVISETPLSFLQHLKELTYIERKPLRYVLASIQRISLTDHQLLRRASHLPRPHPRTRKYRRLPLPPRSRHLRNPCSNLRKRLSPNSRAFRIRKGNSPQPRTPFHMSRCFHSDKTSLRQILFGHHHIRNNLPARDVPTNAAI